MQGIPRYIVEPGELRQRVGIEVKTISDTTGRGAPVITWPTLAIGTPDNKTWAKVEALSGRKLEIARQLVPTATHLVTMRYRVGLDAKEHRLTFNGRVFNIGFIDNVEERNVKLEITCTEERR